MLHLVFAKEKAPPVLIGQIQPDRLFLSSWLNIGTGMARRWKNIRYEYLLLAIFLGSAAFLLMPWIHGNDGAGYYAPTRSIVVDGDLDLQKEYEFFVQDRPLAAIRPDPNTGKYYTQYPVGVSLIWLPAVYLAHGISAIFGLPTTGYTTFYYWILCFWSAFLAFGGLWLLFRFLEPRFGRRMAFWSVLAGWLATNLFFYMFFQASLSHAVSFFVMTLFFLQCHKLQYRKGYNRYLEWGKMGLLAGFVFIIRYQDGIVWLIPAIIALGKYQTLYREEQWSAVFQLMKAHLLTIFAGCLTILPDLLLNVHHHHRLWVSGPSYYHGAFISQQWWYGLKVLFSANHGLLFWTPAVAIALIGLMLNPLKAERRLLLITLLLHILVTGFWSFWHGAQSYSHRFFVGYIPLFIYGFALFQKRLSPAQHRLFRGVILFLMVLNGTLMVQYGLRMIPAEGPLDIAQFLTNFQALPEMLAGVLEFIQSKIVPDK